MEAAIRFSQHPIPNNRGHFLHIDVGGKVLKLCDIQWTSCKDFSSKPLHHYAKVPAFRTFDWHPVEETLIAVGSSGGEATLLNIAEGKQDSTSFSVRYGRLCNAVSLSTQNLLATGLDKVRNDFCLNVWDFNQRLPESGGRGFSKGQPEPLHRLAAGEPISSVRFFQGDPQLLVAGVKGQFVRLYDLREPTSGSGLQFQTRCVHNLAIDSRDENYFASCYPQNDPSVCLWDRRMISNTVSSRVGSERPQPEATLEVEHAITLPGTIWSLRYSKTRRGRLGVLSSTGQVRLYDFGKEVTTDNNALHNNGNTTKWEEVTKQDAYLDRVQDIYRPDHGPTAPTNEMDRVVSFDFMTGEPKPGQPEIIILDVEGKVWLASSAPPPQPSNFSSTGSMFYGERLLAHVDNQLPDEIGERVNKIRREAEPRNSQRKAIKQSKSAKSTTPTRMSSSANQAWNSDLGFFEKEEPLQDMLTLSSIARLRCEAGYLLNATKNKDVVCDSTWLQSLWGFIERQERISQHNNMTQENLDLAHIGIYGIWMEHITKRGRLMGSSTKSLDRIILDLARRLNILPGKLCATEYRGHRQLCLLIVGQAWSYEDLEHNVKRLISQNQQTKAAAIALFADERKLASQALRHRTASQAHKMVAMALASSTKRSTTNPDDDNDLGSTDEWTETITSLSDDLVDPYARAILAFVKSNDWSSVLQEVGLPLKYRVGIALRHLVDTKLTAYLSQATRTAIEEGDVEGVILTGTGTKQSMDLMTSYIARYGDLQTAILALSPYIPKYMYDDEDIKRRFEAWREAYRMQIMSWGLKFHRVRFDIASHKVAVDVMGRKVMETPNPQVRLVCTFCNQGLARFEQDGNPDGRESNTNVGTKFVDTQKHPLTSAKAAAIGTVCPKCGRHLPRCGVCDLWLGSSDESYMRWYRKGENGDMNGSAHTTIDASKENENAEEEKQKQYEQMMARFVVFCVKCTHGFHAGHARMWFGDKANGENGHRVCPVATCDCVCKEVIAT